jgi:hypothetical protein
MPQNYCGLTSDHPISSARETTVVHKQDLGGPVSQQSSAPVGSISMP